VFGHHHRWFDATMDGTRFFGLPQSWLGYALLEPDGSLRRVDHRALGKPAFRLPFWRWLRRGDDSP
jgi:hypothetical protein